MKENRTLVIAMSFAALIIMSVAYAAFANVITITANSTAAGMGKVEMTATCDQDYAIGITSAVAPDATADITGNVINLTGTLHQPGDKEGCLITITNKTPFTVKTVSGMTGTNCTNRTGTVAAPVAITISNKIAAGTSLAPNSSVTTKITFSYFSATTQGQPTTTSASISCALVWAQA